MNPKLNAQKCSDSKKTSQSTTPLKRDPNSLISNYIYREFDGAYAFLSRFCEVPSEQRIGCIATLASDPWLTSNNHSVFASDGIDVDEVMGALRLYETRSTLIWDQEMSYKMQRFGPDFG